MNAARFAATAALMAWHAGAPAHAQELVFEIDRAHYELVVRDLQSGEQAPILRVATGSPARATPKGEFSLHVVILNPAWTPGEDAEAAGAERRQASLDGPMGAVKIPFADQGSIALHGGGDPLLLGKPVSGGCVRASDAELLRLVAWLDRRAALAPPLVRPDGEIHRAFRRPAVLRVR